MEKPTSRERILAAARELFTAEGYEHATIARIREKSGVSNGTLFHHFATKEAILDALYVQAMKRANLRFFAVLDPPPDSLRTLLRGVVDGILTFAVEEPDDARIIYYLGPLGADSASRDELNAESVELLLGFKRALAPYAESGELKRVPDTALMAIVQGPAHLIAKYWLADTEQFAPPTNLTEVFTDAAVASLTGTPAGGSTPPRVSTGQLTVELVDEDGNLAGLGRGVIEFGG